MLLASFLFAEFEQETWPELLVDDAMFGVLRMLGAKTIKALSLLVDIFLAQFY